MNQRVNINVNEKIAILNDLGDPGDLDTIGNSKWHDYLQYGFTQEDVADLSAVLVDEDLYEAPQGKEGRWLHLHTWRTLGQLKAVDAIDAIISSFGFFSIFEDKSAFNELPEVLAMIGEPAIEAVGNSLSDFSISSYSRLMANDALAGIAKTYPETRDKVVLKYKDYLAAPDYMASLLNAYVIVKLIDLKAVNLLDDMRPLFEKNCVELDIVGDLESVKAKLLQDEAPK